MMQIFNGIQGAFVPMEAMKSMNFDTFESKGTVIFKGGYELRDVVKVGIWAYSINIPKTHAFVFSFEINNDIIESYIPTEIGPYYK
jgi:hypothetical protein